MGFYKAQLKKAKSVPIYLKDDKSLNIVSIFLLVYNLHISLLTFFSLAISFSKQYVSFNFWKSLPEKI